MSHSSIGNTARGQNVKKQRDILVILETRFNGHMYRHGSVEWVDVVKRIQANPKKRRALVAMEETGGEPDVVGYDQNTGEYIFCDCSLESPIGRRSLCYDNAALVSRKRDKPKGSAMEMAATIGIEILLEEEYKSLQALGNFDLRTSSWVQTPEDIRSRGAALFSHKRFKRVFVFHNDAESYFEQRGFRGLLRV